jgi:hypothetical protein
LGRIYGKTYAVEMGSGAMMNISNLIRSGSGIQKLMGRYTDSMVIS